MDENSMIGEQMSFDHEPQLSEREAKAQEITNAFDPNRMKVVRKELFASLRDPAVTIRDGSITFNTACINGMEDVVYVNLMIDEGIGFLSVQWFYRLFVYSRFSDIHRTFCLYGLSRFDFCINSRKCDFYWIQCFSKL